ncbi:protein RD3-like [Lethenteron reissneri]|uniref:protein RD3-like n=1 Tax=Lethenteron reissneri TaxID=7753 RepID=UPI002AB76FCB|nr:protein RD3-like [Lethenteron reissneri]
MWGWLRPLTGGSEAAGGSSWRSAQRDHGEAVAELLMLELSGAVRDAERTTRAREAEFRRLRSGVDYSWLASPPRPPNMELPPAERMALEALCAQVRPADCGPTILRFRQTVCEFEAEPAEVVGLFRNVVREVVDRARSEEALRRLSKQWGPSRRGRPLAWASALLLPRSPARIHPSDAATADSIIRSISEDVERGGGAARVPCAAERGGDPLHEPPPKRAFSMPELQRGAAHS